MKQPNILLGLILCAALFLRLIFLGAVPAGFTPDEAGQAYSAYSLLKTGRDEWGASWPITSFKSFLDYKAPLQTYLMIPSIALFGLNEFGARFPSAIFGVLAVLAVYLLANQLFERSSFKIGSIEINIGHLSAFFLAISPWHLQFSRTALEVNLSSFLFPLGLYFFLKSQKIILTAIFWGICLYTYHAAKVFLPLFIICLFILYYRDLLKAKGLLILSAIVGLVIISPLIFGLFLGHDGKRGGDLLISSLSDLQIKNLEREAFYSPLSKVSSRLPRLFHNPVVYSFSKFAENYLSYYSPSFWFTEGGREITYSVIPGRGLLYFWMLPLVIYAVFELFCRDKKNRYLKIITTWLLLAAIPAALTKEGYRPNRAGSFAVLWEMLAAYGAIALISLDFKYKKIATNLFLGLSLILVIFYFEDYLFNSSTNYPTALSYGWREAIGYIKKIEPEYQKIVIERGSQSQAFVAFYTKYDPREFQKASTLWSSQILLNQGISYLDQLGSYQLGKYSFEDLNWPEDKNGQTLYLSQPSSLLPSDRRILHTVDVPDGHVFEIFDFKNEIK